MIFFVIRGGDGCKYRLEGSVLAFYIKQREAHDHFLDLGLGCICEDFLSLGGLHNVRPGELAAGELSGQIILIHFEYVCCLSRSLLGVEV